MPLRLLASLSVLAFMTMGCVGAGKELASSTQPSVSSLTERPVVGALGLPLGTYVEIRASIIEGRELRLKFYDGSYLLRVTEVDGRPLAPPPVLEFSVPLWVSVKFPNGHSHHFSQWNADRTDKLDAAQFHALEKAYVGKPMRLLVYETGGYSGRPPDLPNDLPVWADRRFEFYTSLVVLAERP